MTWSKRKDPDAVLDWAFNWKATVDDNGQTCTPWLQTGETITDYTVTVEDIAGDETTLVNDDDSESNGLITVWLSGGTAGRDYKVTCHVETNAGRIDDRTRTIEVRER